MKLPSLPADQEISRGANVTNGFWLFFDSIVKFARQCVLGGPALTTIGAIPKVTAAGTLGESSLTDDGAVVSGTEPLHLDTGATPQNNQVALRANGAGSVGMLAYTAGNVKVLFDCEWIGGVLVARHTECAVIVEASTKLTIYGCTGQVVGTPAALVILASIDLATGNVDAATGVYKVAGTQVVGPRGAALTAASAYGGGVAGGTYTGATQTLINALITQTINLKTRLDEWESRAQAHGLIS